MRKRERERIYICGVMMDDSSSLTRTDLLLLLLMMVVVLELTARLFVIDHLLDEHSARVDCVVIAS